MGRPRLAPTINICGSVILHQQKGKMSSDGGIGFGYFLALLVLIAGIPAALLLAGVYRKRYTTRFETHLGDTALQSAREMRRAFVLHHAKEMNSSLKSQASRLLRMEGDTSEGDFEEQSLRVFQDGMLQGRVYWGISDLILTNGSIMKRSECSFSLKPGIFEDFLFTAFNQTNPLPLMFGDDRNPESMFSRFVIYCTAQAFALILYLFFYDLYSVISILISPLIVLCEHWLRLMLFCPCLTKSDIFLEDAEDEYEDTNQKLRRVSLKATKASLRCAGALLSLPLFLTMLIVLIIIAVMLTSKDIKSVHLAEFLWAGIVSPFLIKLLLLACRFMTFTYPTNFSICGFTFLEINLWTQSKKNDVRLDNLSRMSADTRLLEELMEKEKLNSQVDMCYATVFCWKCSELKHRHFNRFDCLQPSVYVRDRSVLCTLCNQYYSFLNNADDNEQQLQKKDQEDTNVPRACIVSPVHAECRTDSVEENYHSAALLPADGMISSNGNDLAQIELDNQI